MSRNRHRPIAAPSQTVKMTSITAPDVFPRLKNTQTQALLSLSYYYRPSTVKVSLDRADCFISILECLSESRFYSEALPPNKSMAAAAGSLLFSNLDHSVLSKSWLNRSVPPPRSRREPSPLWQRSLWCQVSFANPKQKPEYAAVSNIPSRE